MRVCLLVACLASAVLGGRQKRFLSDDWWDQFHSGVDRLEQEGRKDFSQFGRWADRVEQDMRPTLDTWARNVERQAEQVGPTINHWAQQFGNNMGPVLDTIDRRIDGVVDTIMDTIEDSPLFEQTMVDRMDGSPVITGDASVLPVENEGNLNLPSRRPGIFGNLGGLGGLSGLGGLDLGGLSSLDPFSVFGQSRKPWWKGENVCVERDVIEEGDEREAEASVGGFGVFQMNMQMTQCRDGENVHECKTTINENGLQKTVSVTYSCCHGYSRERGRGGCTRLQMDSLRQTMEDTGAEEFLALLEENELTGKLGQNLTIFAPTDDAITEFHEELTKLNIITGSSEEGSGGGITYNIDDGLVYRKKRQVAVTDLTETPRMQDILLSHMTPGFVTTYDMRDETSLITENSMRSALRLTVYNTYPRNVVMANCAKVVSSDNVATNGIVHLVNKVIMPAQGSIAEVLSADVMFRTFYDALERAGITETLSNDGQFTIFAPTEQAFDKLDSKTRDKILSGNGCAQDILNSHLLPNVVCSGVIEGRAKTNNMLNKYIVLDRDDEGNVLVEGKQLVVKDMMATNGVIHVIEDVIIPESSKNVPEVLREKKLDGLLELFEVAGLTGEMENLANMTIFAPSEKALSDLPPGYLDNLKKNQADLEEFLMYHVTTPKRCKCDLNNNMELQSGLVDKKVRINNYGSRLLFGDRSRTVTAQCARLVDLDNEVCGGFIHTVDKVLLPPAGDLIAIIKASGQYSRFLELLKYAEMESELALEIPHTILVPTDDAFDNLDAEIRAEMFEDTEVAKEVIKKHILKEMVCCSGVKRNVFLFNSARRRSVSGEVTSMRRSDSGHIFADKASVSKCDMVATNGVAHAIDEVLLPIVLKPQREIDQMQRRKNVFRTILDPFNIF